MIIYTTLTCLNKATWKGLLGGMKLRQNPSLNCESVMFVKVLNSRSVKTFKIFPQKKCSCQSTFKSWLGSVFLYCVSEPKSICQADCHTYCLSCNLSIFWPVCLSISVFQVILSLCLWFHSFNECFQSAPL